MRVNCEPIAPVSSGGRAILRITSINDGTGAVAWPVRIHPDEATVSFIVDGVRHRGAEQVDSVVETVTLEPGQALSTGVLVFTGDRGAILPTSGEIRLQVAVRPPGVSDEILSNVCTISVVEEGAETDEFSDALCQLDAAAVALRNGEDSDSADIVENLVAIPAAHRPWVATALLPPAPLPDDGLLVAARATADSSAASAEDESHQTLAIIDGVPYTYDANVDDNE